MNDSKPCLVRTKDCAACQNGYCIALYDTDFGSKTCPFYRSRREQAEANRKCLKQLKKRRRYDLIEKYHIGNK